MIRSIIVEDNANHSTVLTELLKEVAETEILAICDTVEHAAAAIAVHNPELLFLDIALNGNSRGGFELLERVGEGIPDVIFTTAHIDHNIDEIRRCGLAWVVKPYVANELADALKKYRDKSEAERARRLSWLRTNLRTDKVEDKIIFLNVGNDLYPVRVRDILYCYYKDPLATFVIAPDEELARTALRRHDVKTRRPEDKQYVEWQKHVSMKDLVDELAGLNFCRIHNSSLVNMLHVTRFIASQKEECRVKLSNGELLDVSAKGKKEFLAMAGR